MRPFMLLALTLSSLLSFTLANDQDGVQTLTSYGTSARTYWDGTKTCTAVDTTTTYTAVVPVTDSSNPNWQPCTTTQIDTSSVTLTITASSPAEPSVSATSTEAGSTDQPTSNTGTSAGTTHTSTMPAIPLSAATPSQQTTILDTSGISTFSSTVTTVVPQLVSADGTTTSFDNILTQVLNVTISDATPLNSILPPTMSGSSSASSGSSLIETTATSSSGTSAATFLGLSQSNEAPGSSSQGYTSLVTLPTTSSTVIVFSTVENGTPTSITSTIQLTTSVVASSLGSSTASSSGPLPKSSSSLTLVTFTKTFPVVIPVITDGTISPSTGLSTAVSTGLISTTDGTEYIFPTTVTSGQSSDTRTGLPSTTGTEALSTIRFTTSSSVAYPFITDGTTSYSSSVTISVGSATVSVSDGSSSTLSTSSDMEVPPAIPPTSSTIDSSINETDISSIFTATDGSATWSIATTTIVTASHIATVYYPSPVGKPLPTPSPTGMEMTFSTPIATTSASTCTVTDTFNPFFKTDSCSMAYGWASSTRLYDPVCITENVPSPICLCPFCTRPQKECWDHDLPADGSCPAGWLCDITSAPGATIAQWKFSKTSHSDLPWCASPAWDNMVTCMPAEDGKSCTEIGYPAAIATSTSTDSNGTVWAMPNREWKPNDALNHEDTFKNADPKTWLKILLSAWCKSLPLTCVTWNFRGYGPAPFINFPPIGPRPLDIELAPVKIATIGPDKKPTNVNPETNPSTPTRTATSTAPSSSCLDQTFTYSSALCSTVTDGNNITSEACATSTFSSVGCIGAGSFTVSIIPCSTTTAPEVFSTCPVVDGVTITTSCNVTTVTVTGCYLPTMTTVAACPISFNDYNDPAVASTLSAWLSLFTFSLPAVTEASNYTNSTTPMTTSTDLPPGISSSAYSWLTSDVSKWTSYTAASASSASISSASRASATAASTIPTSTVPSTPTATATGSCDDINPLCAQHVDANTVEIELGIVNQTNQHFFVATDGKQKSAQGSHIDFGCSFKNPYDDDDPVDLVDPCWCGVCQANFTLITIGNGTRGVECDFTVMGRDDIYHMPPLHNFDTHPQLESITCRK